VCVALFGVFSGTQPRDLLLRSRYPPSRPTAHHACLLRSGLKRQSAKVWCTIWSTSRVISSTLAPASQRKKQTKEFRGWLTDARLPLKYCKTPEMFTLCADLIRDTLIREGEEAVYKLWKPYLHGAHRSMGTRARAPSSTRTTFAITCLLWQA
jgi:hypothetical protein